MATAYYFAAHGAHFPAATLDSQSGNSSPSTPPSHSERPNQAPEPPKTPLKNTRADSVISEATNPRMSSQTDSPFFRLPAELRNQIYALLLAPNASSSLSHLASSPRVPVAAKGTLHPAIVRTCARIHCEATSFLYSPHVFTAHASLLTSLPHLVSPASPVVSGAALGLISRWTLTLRLDTDPRFSARAAKEAFSGAEFFELRVCQSMFDGCGAGVLRLFVGVSGVKCARVRGSVEEGLARWLEGRMMRPLGEWEEDECACAGERRLRCEGCNGRVWLDRNGAGVWEGEGDAWRFGNR